MVIENDVQQFIRRNSIASIGTDGLMGNKIVNINSGKGNAERVKEGDQLETQKPIDQDAMIRTLNATNENMQVITSNLRTITDRINEKNTLWSLLMDTVVAENVKAAIVNIRLASNQTVVLTGNLSNITGDVANGKGTLGALINDTTLSGKFRQVIVKFESISDTMAVISGDVSGIVSGLQNGEGSVGVLLKDTTFIHALNATMDNMNKGSVTLNEDLEALKHSWPFRRYFRKQGKLNKAK
jgi:phospholipid/cholesterol/gamma-HCH transport system substrate-binding protein